MKINTSYDVRLVTMQLQGLASRCVTCAVISKDLLEEAVCAIQSLQKRVEALESTQTDPLTEPHGDLVDRDVILEDLLLDESTEVIARTNIINEYLAIKLENAPVVVPANRKNKEDTRL